MRIITRMLWVGRAGLAATLAILVGCATRQAAQVVPVAGPDAAVSSIARRDRLLTSLQTPAIMNYSGPSGHFKAREQFTVRRPASLRIDAMSPMGVALSIAADERQIAIFNPSDNTLIRGSASPATLERFARIPLAPAQAVQLLLGLAPDQSILNAAPVSSRVEDQMRVLAYAGTGAFNYELRFSGGQLALLRARDMAGHLIYEVNYSNYRDIGGINFPLDLDARFISSATTIKLHYTDPLIDREIADSTFVLSPGPATRLIQLGFAAPAVGPG